MPSTSRKNNDHSSPRRWISPISAPASTRRSFTSSSSARDATVEAEVIDGPAAAGPAPLTDDVVRRHLDHVERGARSEVEDEHARMRRAWHPCGT